MGSINSINVPELKSRYEQQIVFWIDKNTRERMKRQEKEQSQAQLLNKAFSIVRFHDVAQFMKYFDQFAEMKSMVIICQGSQSDDLLKQLNDRGNRFQHVKINIFCVDANFHKQKLKNERVLNIFTDTKLLIQQIKKSNVRSSLPKFRIIDSQKSNPDAQKSSFILNALTHKINDSHPERNEMVNDFITSFNHFYKAENPMQYPSRSNHQQILKSYASRPTYQYVKASIQSGNIQQMTKIKIFISDLFQTIKEMSSFKHRQDISESVVYCGGFYDKDQINSLCSLVNRDIEFLGFLEAFKKKKDAQIFKNNVLLTIHIPMFFKDQAYNEFRLNRCYINFKQLEDNILFNIKSVMRVVRYSQQGDTYNFELVFGVDQMLKYAKNSEEFLIHKLKRQQFPDDEKNKCTSCGLKQHFIQAKTHKLLCLPKIKITEKELKEQSLFYLNSIYKFKGIAIKYSKQSQQIMVSNQANSKQTDTCPRCHIIIRCSSGTNFLCICKFLQKSSDHSRELGQSLIYIQGAFPRILSIMTEKNNLKAYQHCQNNEEMIGNSLMFANKDYCYLLANQWFNKEVLKDSFKQLSPTTQSKMYCNRGEALYKCNRPLDMAQYQLCLHDFYKSIELLKHLETLDNNERKLLAKCYYFVSLIKNGLRFDNEAQKDIQSAITIVQKLGEEKMSLEQIQTKITYYKQDLLYKRRRQRFQQAIISLQKIIQVINDIHPVQTALKKDQAQYYKQLADTYRRIGENDKALKALQNRYGVFITLYGRNDFKTVNSKTDYTTLQMQLRTN